MTKNNFARIFAIGAVAALALTGCQADSEDPIVDGTQVSVETPAPVESEAPEETATTEPEATPSETEAQETAAMAPEDYNGRWCAAPDSPVDSGCITIEWPAAVYENGQVSVSLELMNMDDVGCLVISEGDAPFGSFCPAGVELDVPNPNFPGSDYPDQDRLWNSQTGIMYLRD